jgi:trimethylamine---corrinoid protein Co-methyltransferase
MKRNVHAGHRRSGGLRLEVFTDDELHDIHFATLEVLERTGVFVGDDEARDIFASAGCRVDRETGVVKIPGHVVDEAIRSAPSRFVACGRDPANDFVMEADRVGFTNFGEGVQVIDVHTGVLRPTVKQDVADTAKLVDALADVDVYERAVSAEDMPPESVPLHQFEAWVTNTSKPGFMGPMNGFLLERIVEMAAAASGGLQKLRERPLVTFVTCPVSPLKLIKDVCEIVMGAAKAGLGVNVLSMAMAGGSSPVTLAGTLVTHNAEVLSGLTLAQLTRRGTPVVYGSSTTAMDLRLAAASVGSPECGLIGAAVAQLARFYLLPSWVAGA